MKLFDLHCDTPLEAYRRSAGLRDGDLHVTAEKLSSFTEYRQLAAYCAPYGMTDDDAYGLFFRVADNFRKTAAERGYAVARSLSDESCNFYLTVEDARILGGDPSRIDALRESGVVLVTPLWGGRSCVGGAHDTNEGLTPFGEEAVRRCAEAGILVDISHASERSVDRITDILAEYGIPPIATHSNAYALCPHSRNLKDERLSAIKDAGGIVGVSLYPPHLCRDPGEGCTSEDAARHIVFYLEKLGEDSVALGCDFDGIGSTPSDIRDVSELINLRRTLLRLGVSEKVCEKVFFDNADRYFKKAPHA